MARTIRREKPQQCDFCGKIAELRPYGPNYECICFECGNKNKEVTEHRMIQYLKGEMPNV